MRDLWTPLQVDNCISYFGSWLESELADGKSLKSLLGSSDPGELDEETNRESIEMLKNMRLENGNPIIGGFEYIKAK